MSKKKDKAPKPSDAPEAGVEGAEGEAPAKKKSPLKLIIIAAVAGVLVLGGGGGAAYFLVLKPKPHVGAEAEAKPKKKEAKKEKEGEAAKPGPDDPVITDGADWVNFTPPKMIVNLQGQDGKSPVLSIALNFEVEDHETAEAMKANMPRMNDMIKGFLSELRTDDIAGSMGRMQLKMEILRRANLVFAPAKINAVDIQDLLVS